jgi:restriction system protein
LDLDPITRRAAQAVEPLPRTLELSVHSPENRWVLAAAPNTPDTTSGFEFVTHALVVMWPLWVLVALIGAGKLLVTWRQQRRLKRAGILEIDRMSGPMFEQRLAVLFRDLGYRAEVVGRAGGDYGGDLVISQDKRKTLVQAKCWKQNVGVKAVQEAVAARGYYETNNAMVVTNARFTKQAHELARKNKVELWGRDELVAALLKAQKRGAKTAPVMQSTPVGGPASAAPSAASAAAVGPEIDTATSAVAMGTTEATKAFCARCGDAVSDKVRDYCLAHPTRFKGLIYCFKHQRGFHPAR